MPILLYLLLYKEKKVILGCGAGEYLNTNNAIRHGLPDDPEAEIGTLFNLYADENGNTPLVKTKTPKRN